MELLAGYNAAIVHDGSWRDNDHAPHRGDIGLVFKVVGVAAFVGLQSRAIPDTCVHMCAHVSNTRLSNTGTSKSVNYY